jgi:hypothetical protein
VGGKEVAIVVISGFYAGRRRLRMSGGRLYLHIPADVVGELSNRRVRVTAIVNAEGCSDRRLHGSIVPFVATLVKVGASFRLNIPSHYAPALAGIANCSTLDVWLAPLTG